MGWFDRLLGRKTAQPAEQRGTFQDWVDLITNPDAFPMLRTTMPTLDEEQVVGQLTQVAKSNGPTFALMLARLQVFSQARFQWTRFERGEPGDLFGSPELRVLERPWGGGTTADLLARMEMDVTGSGNSYIRRIRQTRNGVDRLVRMRPDWVTIIMGSQEDADNPGEAADVELLGFAYIPRGDRSDRMVVLEPSEVAHYAPVPDPDAVFAGMSWITPVLRDIWGDNAATIHKDRFFRNAASPNLAIKFDPQIGLEQVKQFKEFMEAGHKGAWNAYKCLHPDTDVAMWDGRRVPARGITPGDVVVAWNEGAPVPGIVSEAEWQPASPIVTVTTQRGRVIRTNDRHPFLVGGQWVDASNLRPGDMLTTGLGWGDGGGPSDVTDHEAWLLGSLVGDGSLVSSTPVVSAWDEGVRERFARDHQLKHTGKGHDYRMLGVTKLAHRYGLMGARSWEKRIPEAVMVGSASVRAAFLSGLVDTDGHVTDPVNRRTMELGITSVSRELLADAQHLLASLGINASLSQCAKPGQYSVRGAWRLSAFGNAQARVLAGLLDLACSAKRQRLEAYASTPMLNTRDSSRFDRVASVEIGEAEPTIGIEVAEHHTHVTGGVVTHNTLYLGGGADPVPIGKDMQQVDFAVTTGKGESRLAAAAGVPPSWVGFSEGLQGSSLNAGNFTAARRRFGDGTMQHLWANAASSLQPILRQPPDRGGQPDESASLWFVTRGIPFLNMDAKDAAEVQWQEAQTITALVRDGFTAESAIDAVTNSDWSRLRHTGLMSVQMQEPGAGEPPNGNGNQEGARDALLGRQIGSVPGQ